MPKVVAPGIVALAFLAVSASCAPSKGGEGEECSASCSGGILGGCTYSCEGTLFCDERPWPHVCRRRPAVGEPCETPPVGELLTARVIPCSAGLYCKEGTCAALLGAGQPCTRADQPQCVDPLWCVRVDGGRSCLPAGGSGQRCRTGVEKVATTKTTCDAELVCVLDASCTDPSTCTKDTCQPK